ncbi:MAG: flavodoxin family protein [Rubrivivax sp.]|nr:flavodoxin family protein [Rubrivivax sp.]
MSKTLLGILASPRKLGNCELFVKELCGRLGNDWQLQLVRISDLDIRPCRACYSCLFEAMRCPQKDDFELVVEALVKSDAYVVAAPTYFLSANAGLKRLLDRGLALYGHIDRLWGKPALGVVMAGIEGMEGHAKLGVESCIKLMLGDLRACEVIYGALPGEIFVDGKADAAAARLAKALLAVGAHRGPELRGTLCPLCGGDTFRFLPEGGIRCMLCSSSGVYRWADGRLEFELWPGNHPLFLSRDDAMRHLEWLRAMKDEFLARRKELKSRVQARHLKTGTWIKSRSGEEPDQIR